MAAAAPTVPFLSNEIPGGLKSLIEMLQCVYPDQPNPLQATTLLKYWLGGQDPLDYISMYTNQGDPSKGVPPHWHYVSFGLSDLHGDGRVHALQNQNPEMNIRSGMGFELTFRLEKTQMELKEERDNPSKPKRPPGWPANLLQAIARYCFQTGNSLCIGDNIPWSKSLDEKSNSRLQNVLIAQDAQLGTLETPFGMVDFCQIVGVTDEEVEQASRWNGRGVLNYLRQDIKTGGEWLVTNMERNQSVFELFPERLVSLQDDLEKQGSDLAGVNAEFTFREVKHQQNFQKDFKLEMDFQSLNTQCVSENNRSGHVPHSEEVKHEQSTSFPASMSMSSSSLYRSCPLPFQPQTPESFPLDGLEITLVPYAAKYLMLAIKDRIRHGRHFTFKAQHLALTFVAESVTGSSVSKAAPYAVIGYWIQVLIPDDLVLRMMTDFQRVNLYDVQQRLEFYWPDKHLKLIVDQPNFNMIPQGPMNPGMGPPAFMNNNMIRPTPMNTNMVSPTAMNTNMIPPASMNPGMASPAPMNTSMIPPPSMNASMVPHAPMNHNMIPPAPVNPNIPPMNTNMVPPAAMNTNMMSSASINPSMVPPAPMNHNMIPPAPVNPNIPPMNTNMVPPAAMNSNMMPSAPMNPSMAPPAPMNTNMIPPAPVRQNLIRPASINL